MLPLGAPEDRYELVRKLGQGGSGVVYLVRDRQTGEQLAWKQLQRADERSIARLKHEFRTLANLDHPNVVRLYDLERHGDAWFVSMEYLDGPGLLDYLDGNTTASTTLRKTQTLVGADALDIPRIAEVFLQLATGVRALHAAGVLHRDLKPSNVIVEHGRVVVLDFGLALSLGDQAETVTLDGAVSGTPAYMAPEQLQGRDWGEPNDWYAFGVMLYEALTGCLPIDGRLQELLRRKLEHDPLPVERHVSGLPEELARLCNALVQRQPERRPGGAEVIGVLERCVRPASNTVEAPPAPQSRPADAALGLFGREAQLQQLMAAGVQLARGAAVVVHVSGVSGAGKSALLTRFLDELEHSEVLHQRSTLVLRGRCYERETVAFKALDAIVDALVTQLSRDDDLEVSHGLPRNLDALVQLFPALTRLSVVQRLLRPLPHPARPEQREAAEGALYDLFARLCARRSVIVWIDDLHWGDPDSARILKRWLSAPGIPGLMLILSYRSDEVATSPCLRLLTTNEPETLPAHEIQLPGLSPTDIRALCGARFADAGLARAETDQIVEHIVSEADGSPFLASQLAVLALSELGQTRVDAPEVLTIESLVSRRTAELSDAARKLLNVLAVAGRPLPMRLALQLSAAEIRTRATVHELSGLSLIRSRISEGERLLAVYHDRLREALLASVSAGERAALERQLLEALEADASSDPAWLHALALSCGAHEAALAHGVVAAERAFSSLAFERAAELYRACIGLTPGAKGSLALWRKLALCLAHCGRGRQAAAAYSAAAGLAEGHERLQLKRSAASHLLRSGAFEAGEALLEEVLAEAGLETPSSEPALLAAIAWERTRLGLRGLEIEPRSLAQLPPAQHFKGYLCGTLSIELQPYDPLRAALFQARSLRLALDTHVPELLARALCVAATLAAVSSSKDAPQRAESLLTRADALEQSRPSALVRSNICSARAVCSLLRGQMRETVAYAAEAERTFREDGSSDEAEYYHRFTVISSRVSALFELGEAQRAQQELQHAVQQARTTENLAALLMLSSVRTRAELALDQAQRALLRLEGERAQLPTRRFGLLHAIHIGCVLRVGCATGEHAWALDRTRALAERMEHSVLRRGGPYAFMTFAAHCRLLLNQALISSRSAADARRSVQPDLRHLAAATQPAAAGVVARTRARLALMEGDRETAQAELQRSLACFERLGVRDEAARDRFAYGVLLGSEGEELRRTALAALRAHGYTNPERDLWGYYPELVPQH